MHKMRMEQRNSRTATLLAGVAAAMMLAGAARAQSTYATISVNWNRLTLFKTVSTTQVLPNALSIPGNPLRQDVFSNLAKLKTNYTRLQYWYPFPRLVVAELQPPSKGKTSWDFTQMDSMMKSYYKSTRGSAIHVINVGTIPTWMFVTSAPVTYPADPATPDYEYSREGTQLVDPTGKQVADYFTRVYQWYTQGGFTDEDGVFHASNHHYKMQIWQLLNEDEHRLTVQQYNTIYDAVALSLHQISPKLQFAGTETYLNSASGVSFVDDFLNPKNHQSGVPLDWLDIHNYDDITGKPTLWESELFDQSSGPSSADSFVAEIKSINQTRASLDPQMKIDVDELGTFYGTNINSLQPYASYPNIYWNASAAFHVYCFENLAKLGIDVVSMTQLTAYPNNSPSVAMLNWDTGQPNARYQALKLLAYTFHPGVDQFAATTSSSPDVAALAFTGVGTDRLLLINKSDSTQQVIIPKPFYQAGSVVQIIDENTSGNAPRFRPVTSDSIDLKRFAVAVVTTTN